MAKPDPNVAAHLEWIGFVGPTGLVVSAPALDRAGAVLDRRDVEGQRLLRECAGERCFASRDEPQPWLPDFRAFASSVLGWSFSPKGYAGTEEAPIPAELEAALPDAGGTLRPDFAVRAPPLRAEPAAAASPTSDAPAWQLLVQVCEPGGDFDRAARAGDGLEASSHARMERLLRHTGVPAGLLFNGLALRLISAPRGESSGWLDFRVADMIRTAGRPICTALRLLLNQRRLLSLPRGQRSRRCWRTAASTRTRSASAWPNRCCTRSTSCCAASRRRTIPADESEIVYARRLVAQRRLYGVDRNPVAVDLAKLSLWLITLAKDHPLTFLDHALRYGDSLVGLSRAQIEGFHWKGDAPQFQAGFEVMRIREHLAKIAALRERIREAGEEVSDRERRLWWRDARGELDAAGVYGDLVLAAFFEKAKAKEREALRVRIADAVVRGETHRYRSWLAELQDAEPPLAPFHWEIEFPEVFERDNSGFDAVVGNPPFAGKNTVAAANVAGYPDWLKQVHAGSHGNADQVAHFFRRAFDLVRRDGACGLIATNTIAQGDTRSTGLRWICTHGGEIYRARRRVPWPGLAAVVVGVLHVHKGPFTGVRRLDDAVTDRITAFLFHRGGHDDPARLVANAGKSFVGSYVLGMGFTFDDTDRKGVATPLAEMRRLIEENPRNREVIFPYIGGEEVNTSPTHAHHRDVINFRDWPSRRD